MRAPALIRQVTDPVLERVPVPVVGGENRGRWWNLSSAGSGFASGRRARTQMRVLRTLIRPGDVVWDVGAHHGYVTLLAARRVGPAGRVHSFEPDTRNARILRRHLRWNRVHNAKVHPVALGAEDGTARFGGDSTSKTLALGQGTGRVTVRTGRSLFGAGEADPPSFIKIDVEGAEAQVLQGALDLVATDGLIVVAVHSARADRDCTDLLMEHGFELIPSRPLERARRAGWHGDPDLLCMGPACQDQQQVVNAVRALGF